MPYFPTFHRHDCFHFAVQQQSKTHPQGQHTSPADKPKKLLKEPVFNSGKVKAGLTAVQQPAELLEHLTHNSGERANNFCSLYTRVFPYDAIHLQRKHVFNYISLPPSSQLHLYVLRFPLTMHSLLTFDNVMTFI